MFISSKKLKTALIVVLVLMAGIELFRMHFGLVNHGQEFGTLGQYNRVLRIAAELEGYQLLNHRL